MFLALLQAGAIRVHSIHFDGEFRETIMLSIQQLTLARGNSPLLSGLSHTLNPGDTLLLTGSNGIGKSTLLAALAGLLPPESGEITWQGTVLTAAESDYNEHLFYLGHKRALKLPLSVRENLTSALRWDLKDEAYTAAIDACQLTHKTDQPLHTLSAGQRLRVALAKLWLSGETVWLLDEPFESLDTEMRKIIETKIAQHSAVGGIAVITSHIAPLDAELFSHTLNLEDYRAF